MSGPAISADVLDDALSGFSIILASLVSGLDRSGAVSRTEFAKWCRQSIDIMRAEDPDHPAGDNRTAFQLLRLTADLCEAGPWPPSALVPHHLHSVKQPH